MKPSIFCPLTLPCWKYGDCLRVGKSCDSWGVAWGSDQLKSLVWFWEDGVFSLYRLRAEGYQRIDRSEIPELIELDLNLLARCVLMAQTSRLEAAKAFRKGIQPT